MGDVGLFVGKGGDGVAQEEGELQLVQAPCMILNTPMRSSFLKSFYRGSLHYDAAEGQTEPKEVGSSKSERN